MPFHNKMLWINSNWRWLCCSSATATKKKHNAKKYAYKYHRVAFSSLLLTVLCCYSSCHISYYDKQQNGNITFKKLGREKSIRYSSHTHRDDASENRNNFQLLMSFFFWNARKCKSALRKVSFRLSYNVTNYCNKKKFNPKIHKI